MGMSRARLSFELPEGWDGQGVSGEHERGHEHTGQTGGLIHCVGTNSPHPIFLGCFAWVDGGDIETEWNKFAQEMWKWGLEPHCDEPVFSMVTDGVNYDHYYLVPLRQPSMMDCE